MPQPTSTAGSDELCRRCLALRCRLDPSVSAHRSLLRLIDAELRSLCAVAASTNSSNLNYLETLAAVLLHPTVRSVSRVSKPIFAVAGVHVDVVCNLAGTPSWIFVSARNPRYVTWVSLRTRVERALNAAKVAGPLRPATLVFVFGRGLVGDVAERMVGEFGAVRVDYFGGRVSADEVSDEMLDGWVMVERGIGNGDEVAFEIQIDGDCGQSNESQEVGFLKGEVSVDEVFDLVQNGIGIESGNEAVFEVLGDGDCGEVVEREEGTCSSDQFASLVLKMNVDAVDSVNFDTTALIAMASGISNGGCEKLLKAPENEMRARFKGNYEFVMAQVMSELKQPILLEIETSIVGKKGIVCESVLAEFKELTTMCGGPNEKRRAAELIKRLRIVPDCPSTRMMDLPTTRKIALKNKIVFGTGDHWHAPTLTANSGFIRAVSQTAMSLLTIEHRPRALTGD